MATDHGSKRGLRFSLAAVLCPLALAGGWMAGCDGGPLEPGGVDSRVLSGGDMTVLSPTSFAYSSPAPNLGDLDRHLRGDLINEATRTFGESPFSGLGPTFNSLSCNNCHGNDGRSLPDFWRSGGSGNGSSNFIIRVSTPEGLPVPGLGNQIHDQAIFGVEPDARIQVSYTTLTGAFADGEPYELVKPEYAFTNWAKGAPPENMVWSPRVATRFVGLGLLAAVEEETILDLAAAQEEPISGKPNYVRNRQGGTSLGRFGLRAQSPHVMVEEAFSDDVGVTSRRFPREAFETREPGADEAWLNHPAEIADEDLDALDFYLCTLGVPARRNVNDPEVMRGEELFAKVGCAGCHVPAMETGPNPVVTVGGTPIQEVANQQIRPYSDLLLHDMGPGLADEKPDGLAGGSEWRTTPLWGIGLQFVVNGHDFYLHDGRARSLMEAVLWHGGEAEDAKNAVIQLPQEDRQALIRFLESL